MVAPSLALVQSYLGSNNVTFSDAEVTNALVAEKAAQARLCRVPADDVDWPADLSEALKRRVARNLFMKGVPSGLQSAYGELGVSNMRLGSDPEIKRLEAPWKKVPVA